MGVLHALTQTSFYCKNVRFQWRKYWRGGRLMLLMESLPVRTERDFVVTETIMLEIRKLRTRRSQNTQGHRDGWSKAQTWTQFYSVSRTWGLNFWLSRPLKVLKGQGPCFERILLTEVRKDPLVGRRESEAAHVGKEGCKLATHCSPDYSRPSFLSLFLVSFESCVFLSLPFVHR